MRRKALNFSLVLFLLAGACAMALPFVWMMLSSFKLTPEIQALHPTFFPKQFTVQNYMEVWGNSSFYLYFKNSILLAVVKTVIILYTSALAGYLFSKILFKGREVIFIFVLATMMIPWPVTIIPMYQEMVWFKWIDNYASLILTEIFAGFGIFMMKQFTGTIPNDLIEAARMDGANEFGIFHRITLPITVPAISALGIFVFLGVWDSFLWPMLMLNTEEKYTLPIGLALFVGRYYTNTGNILAGAAITAIPVVVVYMVFQRQFIEGIAMTGIKG